ncbi:hypothetical protein PMAYCL1PPCAC_10613, partial [Pristionchus mayeri]
RSIRSQVMFALRYYVLSNEDSEKFCPSLGFTLPIITNQQISDEVCFFGTVFFLGLACDIGKAMHALINTFDSLLKIANGGLSNTPNAFIR